MKFEDLGIEPSILDSLYEMGYEQPTKIQYETIPFIKQGRDVIGQSQTGSGKTAAFGIPIVEKVEKGKGVQALILAPTRELALQIAGEMEKFSKRKRLNVITIYGGVAMGPQVSGLRTAEIVVGTPGRIMDHMRRGNFDLSNIRFFTLDEADKMINMGFIEDIEFIARSLPRDRQTLLFSATMPSGLMQIRERFTRDAYKVKTANKVREDLLKQYYVDIDRGEKFSLLVHLIEKEGTKLGIVFCNSRRDVDSVTRNLRANGIKADSLHGGMSQAKREQVMDMFHAGKFDFLVATDVAARGLDIQNVSHIFNYSIPKDPEDYANRIGRTARAGNDGKAIALLTRDDHPHFSRIIGIYDYQIDKMQVEDIKRVTFKRDFAGRENGRRSGFGSRFGSRSYGSRGSGQGGRSGGRRPSSSRSSSRPQTRSGSSGRRNYSRDRR